MKEKKVGQTQKKYKFLSKFQITFFLHDLGCTLQTVQSGLFGKILKLEIFKLKVGTCMGGPVPGPKQFGK